MNFLFGIVLIVIGVWLTIVQIKFFNSDKSDYSGGHLKLLICGIGLIVCGAILIFQSLIPAIPIHHVIARSSDSRCVEATWQSRRGNIRHTSD